MKKIEYWIIKQCGFDYTYELEKLDGSIPENKVRNYASFKYNLPFNVDDEECTHLHLDVGYFSLTDEKHIDETINVYSKISALEKELEYHKGILEEKLKSERKVSNEGNL